MTADNRDDAPYEPACEHVSATARRHYWAVAIGLQAVDGLKPSSYLRKLAAGYEQGVYTLAETGRLLRDRYSAVRSLPSEPLRSSDDGTREADLVS